MSRVAARTAHVTPQRSPIQLIADDTDVITRCNFHTTTGANVPTVNWTNPNPTVKIDRIRVTFEPRPLLTAHSSHQGAS